MAVTRIKNNQITDSTITYQKIASGTLVGSLFNPNLTLNSNISIVGNLQVSGNTTTVNSIDTLIQDPLVILNNGFVGTPSYDVGFLVNRNLQSLGTYGGKNVAWIWRESDGAFEGIITTETGTTIGAIDKSFLANITIGNINVANAITTSSLTTSVFSASSIVATGNIVAASGVNATNYTTGALVVPDGGGVGITGDLWVQGPSTFAGNIVAGNIQLTGNINVPVGGTFSNTGVFFGNAGGIGALYAGTSTYTALPTTVLQLSGNVNTYAQVNFQNINNGASATTDYIITADDGTDSTYYGDFGILSSTYNGTLFNSYANGLGTVGFPNDTYLYAHGNHAIPGIGGNLVIGTAVPNTVIRAFAGGMNVANIITTTTSSGFAVNVTTQSTSINTGALTVAGGLGVNGNIHAAAINNTPIGNNTPSTGAFTTLTATSSAITTEFATNFSSPNVVITGGYINNLANIFAGQGTFAELNSSAGNISGSLFATSLNTANAVITGGYISGLSNITAITGNVQNWYTTVLNTSAANVSGALFATSLNTANAVISGGYITALANATITTGNTQSWYATNLNSTNGNITTLNTTTAIISNLQATTGNLTNMTKVYGADAQFSNLFTPNAYIVGGYIDSTVIGANFAVDATFANLTVHSLGIFDNGTPSTNTTTGAVVVTGGVGIGQNLNVAGNTTIYGNLDVKGTITTIESTTVTIVDKNIEIASTATSSAQADGAGITVNGANATLTYLSLDDSWNLNKQLFVPTITVPNLNATTGNITNQSVTTLVTTNFSTANAVISGGYVNNLSNVSATTAQFNNISTANAVISGGYISALSNATITTGNVESWYAGTLNATSGNITTGYFGSLNTANAVIGGGYISALTNAYITTGSITNFSTGNAVVSGGVLNNVIIGNITPAFGKFTTLNVTSNVYLAPQDGVGTVTINPINIGSIDNMNLGASYQGNAYVTNFRSTQSLWASTAGTVFIRAGTASGSSINNIIIGSTDPAAGTFTNLNSQTLTAPTINAGAGNITGALYAGSINTANAVISGGYISALANATITTGNASSWYATTLNASAANISGALFATSLNTANAVITGGYINNLANISTSDATIGNINSSSANISGNLIASGNLVITSTTSTNYTASAATALSSGAAIGGNTFIGDGAVVNGNKSILGDFYVRGNIDNSLLFVNPSSSYDSVAIGGNLTPANIVAGAKLSINSNDAVLLPSGTTAERPSAQGFTDVAGMMRFNSSTNDLEFYNGTAWQNTGSQFTLISDTQYADQTGDIRGNVDGVNTTFVLPSDATTNGTIVSINGVLQLPGVAYSVFSGNTSIVFTEAPAVGDVVDVRILTTTTSVSTLISTNGFNSFEANNTSLSFYTGNVLLGTIENWRIDTNGDFYPVTKSNIGAASNRVDYLFASNIDISGGTLTGVSLGGGSLDNTIIGANIAQLGAFTTLYSSTEFQANGAVTITSGNVQVDSASGKFIAPSTTGSITSFDRSVNRGGEFLVSLSKTDSTEFQMAKVVLVHDDTTPYLETYAVTYTGAANLATFSANISGSTVWLNASSAGANLQVKVSSTLIKV
jgi:hypothetical protein